MDVRSTTIDPLFFSNLANELESIKAIYLHEFNEEKDDNPDSDVIRFSVNLLPSTGNIKSEQYTKLTLLFEVPSKYPDEVPQISIQNPRGLSEEVLEKLTTTLKKLAFIKKGNNMLYELIDYAKESVTSNNFPSGKCMVCLYEFTRDDIFVVTTCFHHFHSICLAGYIQKSEEKKNSDQEGQDKESSNLLACPVCRKDSDLSVLITQPADSYPPPCLSKRPLKEEEMLLEEAKQLHEKFAPLYEKQQQQGGIIDESQNKVVCPTSVSKDVSQEIGTLEISEFKDKTSKTSQEATDEKEVLNKSSPIEKTKSDEKDDTKPSEHDSNKSEAASKLVSSKESSNEGETTEEKTINREDKDKERPKRRSGRKTQRRRTKSDGTTVTHGTQGTIKVDEQQQTQRRSRSNRRPSNRYRGYNYRGQRRVRSRSDFNGGMPSLYRNYAYTQPDSFRDDPRDRPGYFAARVFRPAQTGNRRDSKSKIDDSRADQGHKNGVSYDRDYTDDVESGDRARSSSRSSRKHQKRRGVRNLQKQDTNSYQSTSPGYYGYGRRPFRRNYRQPHYDRNYSYYNYNRYYGNYNYPTYGRNYVRRYATGYDNYNPNNGNRYERQQSQGRGSNRGGPRNRVSNRGRRIENTQSQTSNRESQSKGQNTRSAENGIQGKELLLSLCERRRQQEIAKIEDSISLTGIGKSD